MVLFLNYPAVTVRVSGWAVQSTRKRRVLCVRIGKLSCTSKKVATAELFRAFVPPQRT